MPRSASTPSTARFLSKNHVLAVPVQISGPEWPNVVWNINGRPISPAAISARARTCASAKSWLCPSINSLPERRDAATMASQSASVVAIGFSHSTCRPASSARMVASAWAMFALHTLTASTCEISSSTVSNAFAPNFSASAFARSGA